MTDKTKVVCCLCGNECEDSFGNNPMPLVRDCETNRCCGDCNTTLVVPARLFNRARGKGMYEYIELDDETTAQLKHYSEALCKSVEDAYKYSIEKSQKIVDTEE